MKKLSKLISAMLIVTQTFTVLPLNSFAETILDTNDTGQVTNTTDEEDSSEMSSITSEESTASSSSSEASTESNESSSTSNEGSTSTSSSSSVENSSTSESQTESSTIPSSEEKPKDPSNPITRPTDGQPPQSHLEENKQNENEEPDVDINDTSSNTPIENGDVHFEKDETVDSFIRKIGEPARKIGKEKDLYASVMIAQAILESGSGQSKLAQAPNYNLFGIKGSKNGKTVLMNTQEDSGDGTLYTIQSGFKIYSNYEESFNDYATLLKEGLLGNAYFYAGVWKSNTKNYQDATKFLTGRYATDVNYNKKLDNLIKTYDLTQYDKEVQGVAVNTQGYQVPVSHYTISSLFGSRGGEFHRGIDLACKQGEPIHAAKSGTVIKAEFHSSWGNYVVIQHDDGMTTLYAHQQQYIVKAGDEVKQGQTIGYVGTTGNSTGPHLHLEINRDASLAQKGLLDPQKVIFVN